MAVNNVNDNGSKEAKKTMSMNNDNGRYAQSKQVELIADTLLEKLSGKPESRPFMCKAAYKLSEALLWDNCEQALKGKNPMGLFIWLCKRSGV